MLEKQVSTAQSLVKTKEKEVVEHIENEQQKLVEKFKSRLEEHTQMEIDESDFPEGLEEETYEKKIETNLQKVSVAGDDLNTIIEDLQADYDELRDEGNGNSEEAQALHRHIQVIERIQTLEKEYDEIQKQQEFLEKEDKKLQVKEESILEECEYGLDQSKYQEIVENQLDELGMDLEELQNILSSQRIKMKDFKLKEKQNTQAGTKLRKSIEKKEKLLSLQEQVEKVNKFLIEKTKYEEKKQEMITNLQEKVSLDLQPEKYQEEIEKLLQSLKLPRDCVDDILEKEQEKLKQLISEDQGSSKSAMTCRRKTKILELIHDTEEKLEKLTEYKHHQKQYNVTLKEFQEAIQEQNKEMEKYQKSKKFHIVQAPGLEEFIEELKTKIKTCEQNKRLRVSSNAQKRVPCAEI